MNRRTALLAAAAATLSGCAALTKGEAVIANIGADLAAEKAKAGTVYGIVKGAAEVAAAALAIVNPPAGAALAAGIAALDGLADKAQAAGATASDVAALVSGATDLLVQAAPKITVTGHA